jgi:hypothetical protein
MSEDDETISMKKYIFCLDNLIGKLLEEGEEICKKENIIIRVTKVNNIFIDGPNNYNENRCNIGISAGIINEIMGIY